MSEVQDKKIFVQLAVESNNVILKICDKGIGFPEKLLSKITQPYVSTKAKGSGLGLAIVKKILDDHGWQLNIYNNDGGVVEIMIDLG